MTPPTNGPGLESPSLYSVRDSAPAFELKFLLDEAQAREVEAWARPRLALDSHGDPALDGAYSTTSLYCDTAAFDVFHRRGSCRRRKHRLRRYDKAPWLFLERKSKWGQRVKKRRSVIPDSELAFLEHPMSLVDWPGHWFHRYLVRRQHRPVCRIAYERLALMGASEQGTVRLTLDRKVRGVLTNAWDVREFDGGAPLLTGQVICEFKYRGYLPALFKGIIQSMQLTPSPVSKYRTFLRQTALGLTNGEAAEDMATEPPRSVLDA